MPKTVVGRTEEFTAEEQLGIRCEETDLEKASDRALFMESAASSIDENCEYKDNKGVLEFLPQKVRKTFQIF